MWLCRATPQIFVAIGITPAGSVASNRDHAGDAERAPLIRPLRSLEGSLDDIDLPVAIADEHLDHVEANRPMFLRVGCEPEHCKAFQPLLFDTIHCA